MSERIEIHQLAHFVYDLLVAIGSNSVNAHIITDVFVRATPHGVGHHDIYFLPEWLGRFNDKMINLTPNTPFCCY
jgi:LDH2 family malate/lactate/ureidoglycolate dehydrogenase